MSGFGYGEGALHFFASIKQTALAALLTMGNCFWMPWRLKRKISDSHGISAECQPLQQQGRPEASIAPSIFIIAKVLLFNRRRLQIIPSKHIHFLDEPNKEVSSPLKVKNTSRSFVAFKLQTNSPKRFYVRTPFCILKPGETVLISIVTSIEPSEHKRAKIKEKFKVLSLKVKKGVQYSPELFEEQKECMSVEGILEVAYLDPHGRTEDIEKLKKCLAEAKAFEEALKRPMEDKGQNTVSAGEVLDEMQGTAGEAVSIIAI